MPRPCTICTHPEDGAINRALVESTSNRRVAAQYAATEQAVRRHKASHLPAMLAEAHEKSEEVRRVANGIDIVHELERCFERANLLFDACDRWLRDPDNPAQYDIGPRAEDLRVVYVEPGDSGRPQRKKAALSELLARLHGAGMAVEAVETKRADPRELVLKATAQLQGQIELMAKLMGQLNDGNQVTVNVGTAVQVGSAGDNGSGWDFLRTPGALADEGPEACPPPKMSGSDRV